MNKLISIIIPTFNRAHLITQTLQTVSNQSYADWECIIVDDGSTDDTAKIVADFLDKDVRFKYFVRPSHLTKGANSCRNFGFQQAKGSFIQWFDSDDLMTENYLKIKKEAFNHSSNFVVCSGYIWDETKQLKTSVDLKIESNIYKDYVLWKLKIFTPSILFKKDFLEDKTLFHTSIHRGQEAEFFSRLFYKSSPETYILINQPLFLYRQHTDSKTAKSKSYIPDFKNSNYFYLIKNFNRSEELKDTELFHFFYKEIVKLFFQSIKNSHFDLSKKIKNEFFRKIEKYSLLKSLEIQLIAFFLLLLKKSSFKVRDRWLNFSFQINE